MSTTKTEDGVTVLRPKSSRRLSRRDRITPLGWVIRIALLGIFSFRLLFMFVSKFWMSVLTDIKNRGVADTFFLVCDGLKGLPEVVSNVWPLTTVQTCIIHLIRNTFRLASKKDWDALKKDVRPIYTAPNAAAARVALEELTQKWGRQYGAIIRLWENAWEESFPMTSRSAP